MWNWETAMLPISSKTYLFNVFYEIVQKCKTQWRSFVSCDVLGWPPTVPVLPSEFQVLDCWNLTDQANLEQQQYECLPHRHLWWFTFTLKTNQSNHFINGKLVKYFWFQLFPWNVTKTNLGKVSGKGFPKRNSVTWQLDHCMNCDVSPKWAYSYCGLVNDSWKKYITSSPVLHSSGRIIIFFL